MRRNAAYESTTPAGDSEEIYDQVELPEYEKAHAQQIKRGTPKGFSLKNDKKPVKVYVALVLAVVALSILFSIVILAIASVQMTALSELQITCPELVAPADGSVTITDSSIVHLGLGSKAEYSCDEGYVLVGNTARFCVVSSGSTLAAGAWNGSVIGCQAQCHNLEQLEHGSVFLSRTSSTRQLATYTCDAGYVLVGPNSRECVYSSSEQQWDWSRASSVTPSCAAGIMIDCKEINCRSNSIRCLDQQGYCRISCNDSSRYPCHQASIECPSSGGGCVVDCTSDHQYACLNTTTICPESSDCLVNCMSDYSCQHSDVICSNDCNIDCSGQYACQYGNFTCLDGGNCTVKCEDYRSCRWGIMSSENMALDCTGQRSCEDAALTGLNHINCSGYSSCYRGSISCLDQGNCLSCHGDYSCQSAMISYSSSTEANLECTGRYACSSMTLNCPTDETCNVDCTGDSSCRYSVINCPQNGDCNVKCDGQNGCPGLQVNCPSGGYNCNIKCTNPLSSCGSLSITNTNNVNLQCCGDLSCSGASIQPTSTTQCQYE